MFYGLASPFSLLLAVGTEVPFSISPEALPIKQEVLKFKTGVKYAPDLNSNSNSNPQN